jgi:hypothetical protein
MMMEGNTTEFEALPTSSSQENSDPQSNSLEKKLNELIGHIQALISQKPLYKEPIFFFLDEVKKLEINREEIINSLCHIISGEVDEKELCDFLSLKFSENDLWKSCPIPIIASWLQPLLSNGARNSIPKGLLTYLTTLPSLELIDIIDRTYCLQKEISVNSFAFEDREKYTLLNVINIISASSPASRNCLDALVMASANLIGDGYIGCFEGIMKENFAALKDKIQESKLRKNIKWHLLSCKDKNNDIDFDTIECKYNYRHHQIDIYVLLRIVDCLCPSQENDDFYQKLKKQINDWDKK